ncbi:MAG: CTP synthase [Candidatus Woesearchaeota archaeon]|nr:MAG: CTP synthase [Candidatus Woesearchaeota archaeon]
MPAKHIFVTGGVVSGIGKGIVTSSIAKLIQTQGYNVTAIKIDPYLNFDAGTMRPTEHGEVWVTPDGGEIDQDLGNYERFLDIDIPKDNNITSGKVYWNVLNKERKGEYLGKTVQPIPQVTNEIKDQIKNVAKKSKADFIVTEIGGTVGDYENVLFLEAARQLKTENGSVIFTHVTYLPVPGNIGEMKTKPTQHSFIQLMERGIQADLMICRSENPVDKPRIEKISQFCNVDEDHVFTIPQMDNIYEIPIILEKQNITKKIFDHLNRYERIKETSTSIESSLEYKVNAPDFVKWKNFIEDIKSLDKEVNIGIVGKYFKTGKYNLKDSYISVIEAIKHAAWNNKVKPVIDWIDSQDFEDSLEKLVNLDQLDGIIVPGGFGESGVEGKISTIKYARENKIPYLGLCLGMQLAVVDYARNVCDLPDAHTVEIDKNTKDPVVCILPEQIIEMEKSNYGGTMRLGNWRAKLQTNTKVYGLYQTDNISERHRHRYEVNPDYIKLLESKGLVFSGTSPKRKLMEFLELPYHPYFVATQSHPEFKSRPMKPAPMFDGLIKAAINKKYS